MEKRTIIINNKLDELSRSKFRSSFHLRKYMIKYIDDKGMDTVLKHAYDFINKNLKPADIPNDGKQTPMKGHPVFIARHATATCCRGCLEKWHGISKGKELNKNEVNYVVSLIMEWIRREYKKDM
jgi:exodeoxyribonuclease V alpha subunit